MRYRTFYSLNDTFNFGKHRNETIKSVISNEPSYIQWCLKKVSWFELNEDAKEYSEQDLDTIFQFGKYKGLQLRDVILNHPDYIWWCFENIDTFRISEAAKKLLIFDLSTVLSFGIYKGKTIQNVLEKNCQYVKWILEHNKYFCLNDTTYKYAQKCGMNNPVELQKINDSNINLLNTKLLDYSTTSDSETYDTDEDLNYFKYNDYDEYDAQRSWIESEYRSAIAEMFNYDPDLMWNID